MFGFSDWCSAVLSDRDALVRFLSAVSKDIFQQLTEEVEVFWADVPFFQGRRCWGSMKGPLWCGCQWCKNCWSSPIRPPWGVFCGSVPPKAHNNLLLFPKEEQDCSHRTTQQYFVPLLCRLTFGHCCVICTCYDGVNIEPYTFPLNSGKTKQNNTIKHLFPWRPHFSYIKIS